jgi:hypothetical protein
VWQRNHDIPDAVSDVIDRLLEKKPGKRFASADEVQQHLAELLSRLQRHGLGRRRFRRLPALSFVEERLSRVRSLMLVAAAALLVALIVTGVDMMQPASTPSPSGRGQGEGALVTGDSEDSAAEIELLEGETDFQGDLLQMRTKIEQVSPDSYFLQDDDDPWRRELKELHRDVTEFETNNN